MAEGRSRTQWAHTSLLCALIANAHRDPKKGRAFKPEDFEPNPRDDTAREVIHVTPDNIGELKQAFTPGTPAPGTLKGP